MSTKSRSGSALIERVDDIDPRERKELYERLAVARERAFFEHRAEYAEAIAKQDLGAAKAFFEGGEFGGVDRYLAGGSKLAYCLANPDDCFEVSTRLEHLIPSLVSFVELRRDYIQALEAEGLVDLERKYFQPGEAGLGGMGSRGADLSRHDDTVVVPIPGEGPVDITPDDLEETVGRFGGVTIDFGDRFDPAAWMERPTDPRTEAIMRLIDWWSKNSHQHIGAYLTIRSSDDE